MPDQTQDQSQSQDQHGEKPPEGTAENAVKTFDTWIASQPDNVRALVEDHTSGLRSALTTERSQRKDLERQLKDLGKRFEKGTEERVAIDKMQAQLVASQKQTEFYDEAHKRGVVNLKLAWMAAQAEFPDSDLDWDKLKQIYPQLFATRQTPPGNAGSGTADKPAQPNMNDMIRRAAGYKR